MQYKLLFLIPLLLMSACGTDPEQKAMNSAKSAIDNSAKHAFGYLSNAVVHIYQLKDGRKELLFTEKTSSGSSLEEIGNFKDHLRDFRPNKFYQIEVSGGENCDSDDDAILDPTPSKNRYTYRAIYKGHQEHIGWWKTATQGYSKESSPE